MNASRKFILPGIKLLNGLNRGSDVSDSDMDERIVELLGYHEDSQRSVRDFVKGLPVCGPICARGYRWVRY